VSAASGGACQSGALAAGAGAVATPLVGTVFDPRNGPGDVIGGTIATGLVGGLASVAGGGKFENGAVTAAFGYLFNTTMHFGFSVEMPATLSDQITSA